jgi:hypothetical protein
MNVYHVCRRVSPDHVGSWRPGVTWEAAADTEEAALAMAEQWNQHAAPTVRYEVTGPVEETLPVPA